jgi:hypothetical protein
MNTAAQGILSQMVRQFEARHNRQPQRIVIAPLACLALAIKHDLTPTLRGIAIECRDIQESEATADHSLVKSLAVFIIPEDRSGRLVACDLQT